MGMWRISGVALAILASCSVLTPARSRGGEPEVFLDTEDGFRIAATFYPAESTGARAALLVHMLNGSREDWGNFPQTLQQAGVAVLNVDLRGHGGSTMQGKVTRVWQEFSDEELSNGVLDLKAGMDYLISQPGVDSRRVGIVGASLGANLALAFASRDARPKALVLLSPGLNVRGISSEPALRSLGPRPVLMVASQDDGDSHQAVQTLIGAAPGPRRLQVYTRAGHGTKMFGGEGPDEPSLEALLRDWILGVF